MEKLPTQQIHPIVQTISVVEDVKQELYKRPPSEFNVS